MGLGGLVSKVLKQKASMKEQPHVNTGLFMCHNFCMLYSGPALGTAEVNANHF